MTASPSNKVETRTKNEIHIQRALRLTLIAGSLTLLLAFLLPLLVGPQLPPRTFEVSITCALLQLGGAFIIYRRRVWLGLILFLASAPAIAIFAISQSTGIGGLVTGGLLLIYMILLPQVFANARQVTSAQIFALVVAFALVLIDLNWPFERPPVVQDIFNITLYVFIGLLIIFAYLTLRQFPTYGLRGKLITTTLLVAIVAVIAVAVGVNTFTRRALTQKVGEQLDTLADSQAALIGELFFREMTSLQALSLNERLVNDLAERNASYGENEAEVETALLALDSTWQDASRTHPIVTAVLQNPLSEELKQFQALFPENNRLLITDQHGGLLAATNKPNEYYFAEADWWQAAYASGFGRTSFSNPAINPLNDDGYIEISLPLFATQANGVKSISGILYTTYSLNALEDLMVDAQFGETGQTRLHLAGVELGINEDGQMVIYQDSSLSEAELTAALESTGDMTFVLQSDEPSLVSAERVNTLNHQPIIDEQNWVVTVQQAEYEALFAVEEQQRLNMLLGALVLLVTGGAAAFVGNRLAKPISELTSVAEQVTAGKLTARANIQSQDEIGVLADAFNSMAKQVQESIATLEERVQARTYALETSINVGQRISTILDVQQLVTAVVNEVRNAFNYYHAHIYLIDEDDKTILRMMGGTGKAGEAMLANNHHLQLGAGLVGRAAATANAVLVPDVQQDAGWLPNPLLPETKAETAVPIILGDELLGVLDIQHDVAGGLGEADVEILRLIANQFAITYQNARNFSAKQQQAEYEGKINLIQQQIQQTTNVDEALKVTVRELGRVLGAAKTVVRLGENGNGSPQKDF